MIDTTLTKKFSVPHRPRIGLKDTRIVGRFRPNLFNLFVHSQPNSEQPLAAHAFLRKQLFQERHVTPQFENSGHDRIRVDRVNLDRAQRLYCREKSGTKAVTGKGFLDVAKLSIGKRNTANHVDCRQCDSFPSIKPLFRFADKPSLLCLASAYPLPPGNSDRRANGKYRTNGLNPSGNDLLKSCGGGVHA